MNDLTSNELIILKNAITKAEKIKGRASLKSPEIKKF